MAFTSVHFVLLTIFHCLLLVRCDPSIVQPYGLYAIPNFLQKNCTIGQSCTDLIDSTTVHYYAIDYTYDPSKAIRVTTSMNYKPEQDSPILVVVRQVRGIISWALPYVFPNGMIYSTMSRTLCLNNEINRTQPHLSTIFIEISTSNIQSINYSLRLENVTQYELYTDVKQYTSITPTMPVYYRYTFPRDVDAVFIEVESKDNLCTMISVQSFDCPVYDINEIGVGQGHYQTMSSRSSFNVYANEFPKRNEFLLVLTVKPTDVDCLDHQESASVAPAGFIDIPRQKYASITLTQPKYYTYLYIAIFITIGIFLMIFLATFIWMCRCQDLYEELSKMNLESILPTSEELVEQPRSPPTTRTIEGEENIVESTTRRESETGQPCVSAITTSNNGFVTMNKLCQKEFFSTTKKFVIYPQTMITIAIFYSLPVIQLVLQYQLNINSSGNEDLCYFNFLCARQMAYLTAFNNVFSNIGYCALGVLFLIIVYRRDIAYKRFMTKHPKIEKEYGVPQHVGLFYAMAIGLIMEGIMSGCYHVCPSKQNFQFDTSFMFIIAVLNIIKIYQIRHPDINPRSSGAFIFLAFLILINVVGVYFDEQWFWITYAVAHITICIAFTGKIYYMGRLKVSFNVHVHLWELLRENGLFSRPRYLNRMIALLLANCINFSFAIYGAVYQPESFPNHLLFVLLGNLAFYLFYYFTMKMLHRERFKYYTLIHLVASLVFWVTSLYFFYQEVKSYEVQPAISRQRNRSCILLETYDVHDVWHLLSSFGLFFSFMLILTIDDGIWDKKRTEIAAF